MPPPEIRASQKFLNACSTGDVAMVAEFLDAGADPNARDQYGLTVLIWTGRKGRIEAAKLLLSRGAELEATDRRGRTALCHAACYKRDAYIEYLASIGANVNPIDQYGWTPLDVATSGRFRSTIAVLECLGGRRAGTEA
ncbi:MAG: ankyrin repeat domain-containing protein [Gemmataceae bacterium]